MNSILLLITMTLFGAFGGFFFKKASGVKNRNISLILIFLGTGGLLYFIGALLNILLLKKLPYSIVFPLTSVTYIWTLMISYFFLGEKITLKKVIGIVLIAGGCLLLTR